MHRDRNGLAGNTEVADSVAANGLFTLETLATRLVIHERARFCFSSELEVHGTRISCSSRWKARPESGFLQ